MISPRIQELLTAAADALADGQLPLSPTWTREYRVTFEESEIVAAHMVAVMRAYLAMPHHQQAATYIAGTSAEAIDIASLTANAIYHDMMRAAVADPCLKMETSIRIEEEV